MAVIDLTGYPYICVTNKESGMSAVTIKDSVTSKEYLVTLQSGVIKLINVADDTDILSFSADA